MTKVAVIQMVSNDDLQNNLRIAEELIREGASQGARLAVLPENFALMGMSEQDRLQIAELFGTGLIHNFLSTTAKKYHIWLVGGTIPIKAPESNKVYSSSLVYDDEGNWYARYDKIHLFDAMVSDQIGQYLESSHTTPGSAPSIVDTPVGRLGLAICYDLRFPELFRHLSNLKAEVFVIPAAFTQATGEAHWEILLRARAIENLCFVLAANQGGIHPKQRETYGHSMIIDPWGKILKKLTRGEGVLVCEIDPEQQIQIRSQFPALAHRRL